MAVPQISVTISGSGQLIEGQQYMLTCNVSGTRFLSAAITYQWDRVGDSSGISTSQQLTFNPLRRSDGSQYRCTVTIISPYLSGNQISNNIKNLRISRTYFLARC